MEFDNHHAEAKSETIHLNVSTVDDMAQTVELEIITNSMINLLFAIWNTRTTKQKW